MKQLIKLKLKAKALYLVVFISFIVSVILLLFISSSYYSQVEVLHYDALKQMVSQTNSSINYSLGVK
jgi:uncharacterized membrane protein YfhO